MKNIKYLISLIILLSSNAYAENKISTPRIQYENHTFKTQKIQGKIVYFDLVVDNFEPNPNSELYLAAHVKKNFLEHWIICNAFVYRFSDEKRLHSLKLNMVGYSGPLGRQSRLLNKGFMDFYFSDKRMKSGDRYQLVLFICPRLTGGKGKEPEYIFDKTSIKNLESLISKDMITIKIHHWEAENK